MLTFQFGFTPTLTRLQSVLSALCVAMSLGITGAAIAADPISVVSKFSPGSSETVDHSAWDQLLKSYVKPGKDGLNRVDYAGFRSAGQGELKLYIDRLQKLDPQTLDRAEQFALLANLYNAKTIDIVLDKYPVKSIKSISLGGGLLASFTGGPWKAKVLQLRGVALSLDDIEHGILRPVFQDPRVHYAVNCASVGCPNLQAEAFTGATLGAQLDAGARAYINHARGVSVTSGGVMVSSIYNWFKTDFGDSDAGVLSHLRKYANPELATKLGATRELSGHQYDWSLNDVRR